MNRNEVYRRILEHELVPAMGCTEPIALAYGAAKAVELLAEEPVALTLWASGNIIKNVKSVVVPHSSGMHGMEAAVALGALYGDASKGLQVISGISEEDQKLFPEKMKNLPVTAKVLETEHVLDLIVEAFGREHKTGVRIQDEHTRIVSITRDDEVIWQAEAEEKSNEEDKAETLFEYLNVAEIFDYANTVELSEVRDVLLRQKEYNMAIAREGMHNSYGANIGSTILSSSSDIKTKAKAFAAAASDARMGGCSLPVIINSGSGNQGITVSVPVIIYAAHYEKSEDELLRALIVSNLVSLHLKSGIGRLSAYCGAISAGVGAGAGIAYLLTGDLKTINHTIVNAIAIASGTVCDGAKSSCAAKIAIAVESGILGYEMYRNGNQFYAGEGLVEKGVENTIMNISTMAQSGMKTTDDVIISIMTKCK